MKFVHCSFRVDVSPNTVLNLKLFFFIIFQFIHGFQSMRINNINKLLFSNLTIMCGIVYINIFSSLNIDAPFKSLCSIDLIQQTLQKFHNVRLPFSSLSEYLCTGNMCMKLLKVYSINRLYACTRLDLYLFDNRISYGFGIARNIVDYITIFRLPAQAGNVFKIVIFFFMNLIFYFH